MEAFFALLAGVLMFGLAGFQFLLAAGAPLGRLAWGGEHLILPIKLRIASALTVPLYIFFILVIFHHSEVAQFLSDGLASQVIWPITGLMFVSTLFNLTSHSKLERFVMTPLSLELFISFLIVAL